MSDQFSHYAYMHDSADFSTSFAGTDVKHECYALEQHSYPSGPSVVAQGSDTSSQTRRSTVTPFSWSRDAPSEFYEPTLGWAAPLNGGSVPSTRIAQANPIQQNHSIDRTIYCDMGGSLRVQASIPTANLNEVAMPTSDDHAGCSYIDSQGYHHYGVSYDFIQEGFVAGYSQSLPSYPIAMSIVPRSLSVDRSYNEDSLFPADPTFHIHPPFPTMQLYPLPASHSPMQPIPDLDFDTNLSSPASVSASASTSPDIPSEARTQPEIQLHHATPTHFNRPLSFTVPLSIVEFPSIVPSPDIPFFRCLWDGCGVWITSEKEAMKRHLTCCHDVLLKGSSATAKTPCKWDGCSSSLQKDSLVRHVHIHLGLQWFCSECKGAYTRSDSVIGHARREVRCRLAHPVSRPSELAYRAKINTAGSVTLTKILQT